MYGIVNLKTAFATLEKIGILADPYDRNGSRTTCHQEFRRRATEQGFRGYLAFTWKDAERSEQGEGLRCVFGSTAGDTDEAALAEEVKQALAGSLGKVILWGPFLLFPEVNVVPGAALSCDARERILQGGLSENQHRWLRAQKLIGDDHAVPWGAIQRHFDHFSLGVPEEHLAEEFAVVDTAKMLLTAWLADLEAQGKPTTRKRLKNVDTGNQTEATGLRVALESVIDAYFGKPHLAVALVELGYAVHFYDEWYFESTYPCAGLAKLVQEIRSGVHSAYPRTAARVSATEKRSPETAALLAPLRQGKTRYFRAA